LSQRERRAGARKVDEQFQAAIADHRQGKVETAARLYEAVLMADRNHLDALNNLGILRAQQGVTAEAEKLFRRAVKVKPNSADAHHNLAKALRTLGRTDEAAVHQATAARLRAASPPPVEMAIAGIADRDLAATLNSALQRHHAGQVGEAEALYRKVLTKDPANFAALYNLGVICVKTKRGAEAVQLLRLAASMNPSSAEVHNGLGAALELEQRLDEAVVHYEKAVRIEPAIPQLLNNLGNALIAVHRPHDAVKSLEQAIGIAPELARAHNNLGRALQELGRLPEARRAFEQAVALDPRQAGYYRCLGDVKRLTTDDPHLVALEMLARDAAGLEPDAQIELHFALGKACADIGDHERSFDHFVEANRLKRSQITYNEAGTLRWIERVNAVFTADLIREKGGAGDPSDVPVFIVGMPRSGTTLIEQILASHPKVFGAGELLDFDQALVRLGGSSGLGPGFPESLRAITEDQLRALGADYLAAARKRAPNAQRITDKLPANFLLVPIIHLAFPNARIIHAMRDPIDTCMSCFSRIFAGYLPYAYDLRELGRYYRAYSATMRHWREILPPGKMLDVRYEEVVADLETSARRIVAFCGLEWDDACLDFHRTERVVSTASAVQVRQPIYKSAVGRARPYTHRIQPLLDALEGRDAPAWDEAPAVSSRRDADATPALGLEYLRQGKLVEAEAVFRTIITRRPDDPEAHNYLGTALRMFNCNDEAVDHFKAALAIRADYPEALGNLGNAYFAQDKLAEAIDCLRRMIELRPDLAAPHADLGRALHALGRLDEACAAYERATALDPRQPQFYRALADFKQFTPDDPHLAAMEALAADMRKLSEDAQIELHFTLGKAYADVGRHELSFRHLLAGNQLMRQRIVYDEAATLGSFERIRAVFTPELIQSKAGLGHPSSVPIFIFGMPRSGTTLIEQILATHPAVFGGGEVSYLQAAWSELKLPPDVIYPEAVASLTPEQLHELGRRYVQKLGAAAPAALHVTDKMPANFLLAGLIHLILPQARMIHARRHPIDTCISCFSTLFLGSQPHTYDLGELGRYYRAYEGVMAHWQRTLPSGSMLDVQYETLVADLESGARRIVEFCGLPWDERCLQFHRLERRVWTASSVQVRRPIYKSSIGRWKAYGALLDPLLRSLDRNE
jgi:Flp pilus assembly protein TadD